MTMSAMDASFASGREGMRRDALFVLCSARSGSTLLRFVLDAHPEVACPPETNLPALCAQLAVVWSLIEGAPLSATRGDAPPVIPPAAIAGIRHTLDSMLGPYLARRGKSLLCDKSLGTARYANLLLDIYPTAKFICLYRHPMDVISSGIEACPWGLNGYGLDPYIGASPGNSVSALARYWLDNASLISSVEQRYPERCHRVLYENLVAATDEVADDLFRFAGVAPAPGIARRCLTAEHERFGPADHKIWHTSRITSDSVGRGESIPAGLIPPPVLEQINQLLEGLGYAGIGDSWGTADAPSVPGANRTNGARDQVLTVGAVSAPAEPSMLLDERLRAGLGRADAGFTDRWAPCSGERFTLVERTKQARVGVRWLIDLAAGTITCAETRDPAATDPDSTDPDSTESAVGAIGLPETDDDFDWSVIGTPQTWTEVLSGQVNLGAALRRCDLRYCDYLEPGDLAGPTTEVRIAMMAELLGLTSRPTREPVAVAGQPADGQRPR